MFRKLKNVMVELSSFVLQNAAVSLRDGRLTVLAEEVQFLPAALLSAARRDRVFAP